MQRQKNKLKSDIVTILLSGAGTQTFANVAKGLRQDDSRQYRIIGIDADKYAYGLYLADKSYVIPMANDPNFLDSVAKICKKENVQIFVPLLSKEYNIIGKYKEKFTSIGVTLPISSFETIEVCNDKWLTYEKFEEFNIRTPKTYKSTEDLINAGFHGDYLAKPRKASGSKGIQKITSKEDLVKFKYKTDEYIFQELISGKEFTIDALSTFASEPLVISPRLRLGITDGKATESQIILNQKLIHYAAKIIKDIKIIGACNIQGFITQNEFIFTEINPRFAAGGLPLTIAAGANLPKLLVDSALGVKVNTPKLTDGLIMLRYMTEVIINEDLLVKDTNL